MTPEDTGLLRDLLTTRRVLALSVLLDGAPYAGLLPFALQPDASGLLVHVSALAHHAAGLTEGAPIAFLIHAPDVGDADPLQLPRLGMQGTAHPLDKGSDAYEASRQRYVQKFPASEPIFSLGDFMLVELRPGGGRFVVAFGRAFNVTAEHLRGLAEPG